MSAVVFGSNPFCYAHALKHDDLYWFIYTGLSLGPRLGWGGVSKESSGDS